MKKKILLIAVLFMVTLLTGCGSKEKVVIYTSMEEERNQKLTEMVKKEFPELNVVIQHMATGNSAAKIKNEGTNVEADIVIDLETAHMKDIQKNFADLSKFDSSFYMDGVNTSSNYLAMPDPKTSGTGYGFYLNVVNIMGEDTAIEYFKKLKGNLREYTTSGSGPTNLLKQGEIAIAMGMTAQGVEAINAGYNFSIVELETGSPYNTTSCGIIKGRETNKNVEKVFNWLIKDFGKYDKENYMPDKILKEQENKMKNYPENLKDANMTGIDSTETKTKLIEKWGEVNG